MTALASVSALHLPVARAAGPMHLGHQQQMWRFFVAVTGGVPEWPPTNGSCRLSKDRALTNLVSMDMLRVRQAKSLWGQSEQAQSLVD